MFAAMELFATVTVELLKVDIKTPFWWLSHPVVVYGDGQAIIEVDFLLPGWFGRVMVKGTGSK